MLKRSIEFVANFSDDDHGYKVDCVDSDAESVVEEVFHSHWLQCAHVSWSYRERLDEREKVDDWLGPMNQVEHVSLIEDETDDPMIFLDAFDGSLRPSTTRRLRLGPNMRTAMASYYFRFGDGRRVVLM